MLTYDTVMKDENEKLPLQPSNEEDSRPQAIWVAESADQITDAKLVDTTVLQETLNFYFTERLWAPSAFLKASLEFRKKRGDAHYIRAPDDDNFYSSATINQQSAKLIQAHRTGVAYDLWMLVDMQSLGYGLIARQNISKSTLLFNYTGEFISEAASAPYQSSYKMGIQDELFGTADCGDFDPMDPPLFYDFAETGIIDGRYYRNFSAFAQHAPSAYDLSANSDSTATYIFADADVLKTVATVNTSSVFRAHAYIDGLATQEFHAKHDIPANTMIFIDYGVRYWSNQSCHPELFNKQGACIDYDNYYPSKLYLLPNKVFKAKDVFPALLNKIGVDDLSFDELKRLTLLHLGENRFKGHFACFLSKNPQIMLEYRVNKFSEKKPEYKNNPEKLNARLEYFGLFNNSVKVRENLKPKIPFSFLRP